MANNSQSKLLDLNAALEAVKTSVRGIDIKIKFATSTSVKYIVKSNDRQSTREILENQLKIRQVGKVTRQSLSDSSMEVTKCEIVVGGKRETHTFVYKPIRGGMSQTTLNASITELFPCIAFTTGILDVMDRDQLQGVIAHELAHVANRDTLVSAVAATTAGAIAIVSDMLTRMMFFGGRRDRDSNANPIALVISLVILILAPLAAVMLKSAISRKRESLADATAVSFTRNPAGLRSALEVLAADSTVVQQRSTAVAHIWIESPLDAKSVSKMFSTHPPIQERIAVLKSMESLG